jgi:SPP1 family predicted phage head-tail adaptor
MNREGKKTLTTEMRHRVTIQACTRTADGEGGFSQSWVDSSTVWAAIYPMREAQVFEYRSVGVDASHIVKVRGDVPVAEKDRVVFGSRVFEVLTVADVQERGIVKIISCMERR